MKKLFISLVCGVGVVLSVSSLTEPPGSASIQTADSSYRNMPFPMGVAVSIPLLKNNTRYRALVAAEFTSITAENTMKMPALQPSEGNFNWSNADYLVDFAVQHHQRVHGHTLIWHEALPGFLRNYTGDSAALEHIMKTHIQTVVAHFKGKVTSWDVVNEAFEDNGTLRNSIWRQKLGADYVARCFQYAHEADTGAKLFYNDYGHEYSPAKRTAIINLVTTLKSRGIPVHGIGLQMHTHYNQTDANLAAAISTAGATGLLVHISELDVSLNPGNRQDTVLTPAMTAAQASRYRYIVKTYNALPSAQQFGITSWNVTDGDSWLRHRHKKPDWPLPFDEHYQRKPAYDAILEGVRQRAE